jgi:hypothetical protein
MITLAASGGFLLYDIAGEDAKGIVRDFAVMVIAEYHEDSPVRSSIDILYEPVIIERTETNSVWLYEMVETMLPYISYENIRAHPIMPEKIVIEYYDVRAGALHILGWAIPSERSLHLSEWYVKISGLESIYGTIVHELVHNQGNLFAGAPLKDVEARTTAATVEVLAGMCLRGDQIACQAFWIDVGDLASMSFRRKMEEHGLKDLSEFLMDTFFRSGLEVRRAEKSSRHWMDNPAARDIILEYYGEYPWEQFIIPGVNGTSMRVRDKVRGLPAIIAHYEKETMKFDDTKAMFGIWSFILGESDEDRSSAN